MQDIFSLPLTIFINTEALGIASIRLPPIGNHFLGNYENISKLVKRIDISIDGPNPLGEKLACEIRYYMDGKIQEFSEYPLVLKNATNFQRRVWFYLRHIPYGKIITYEELAHNIGSPKSIRASGQALKRNPFPILLPCHRVIGKDGGLRGFSSGINWKRILLDIERVQSKGDKILTVHIRI